MRIHRFLICAVLLLSATVLYSDEAEEIRRNLPKLQGEEKLLVGEVQQVAWCLAVVPAGYLQQSSEYVNLFVVK